MAEEPGVHNEVSGTVVGGVVQARTIQGEVHEVAQHARAVGDAEIHQAGRDQYIIGGDVHIHLASRSVVTPRQLPPTPRWFTGRTDELTQLTAVLDQETRAGHTVVISAIGGTGGIGKTALTLHWAHHNLDRFPDGQLFVDLRGFGPGQAMTPGEAIRGFLDALGVEPQSMPVDLDAQFGRFRSLVTGRRMLIVLDNARDAAQVMPLLPGSPTCVVLVTSRDRMAGLAARAGAYRLALTPLDEPDAHALLTQRLEQRRLEAEPDAIAALSTYCAGLPLALNIVAGRADAQRALPLSALAADLQDSATRLDALDTGDLATSLGAVLSWSYATLSSEQAAVFGLLGLAPVPDINVSAAASLTNLPPPQAKAVLRALQRVSLLDEPVPDRYRMHDLVHIYAADQAPGNQPVKSLEAALQRLVDFHLHTSHAGDRLLYPQRPPINLAKPVPGCRPLALLDEASTLQWWDAEHSNLLAIQHLAADHGWHNAVWQLAWTLSTFRWRRGYLYDDLVAWQTGLKAAQHLNEPAVLTRANRNLGDAYARLGRHREATKHIQDALTVATGAGDLLNQAHAHQALARAYEQQGDHQQALVHATHSLHHYHILGDMTWQARALNQVGRSHARLGRYQQARVNCEAALALSHRRDRDTEADTLDSLGHIAQHLGQYHQAIEKYLQAIGQFRDIGHTYSEADTLDRLGQTHLALGQHDQARLAWRQALELYRIQHRAIDVDRVQGYLAAFNEAL